MDTYFAPPHFTPDRRAEATQILVRGGGLGCDVEIYDSSLLRPSRAFSFDPDEPEACTRLSLRPHRTGRVGAPPRALRRGAGAAAGAQSLSFPKTGVASHHSRRG